MKETLELTCGSRKVWNSPLDEEEFQLWMKKSLELIPG
jgi:hypothetical protein